MIIIYNSILKQCSINALDRTLSTLFYNNGESWRYYMYRLGWFDIFDSYYNYSTMFLVIN